MNSENRFQDEQTNAWFVTGTDTEDRQDLRHLRAAARASATQLGVKARSAMKPVAAGTDEPMVCNDDVERLIAASSVAGPTRTGQSRMLFQPAIAPHIAAAEEGQRSHRAWRPHRRRVRHNCAEWPTRVLVEGVGGFCVPLGHNQRHGRPCRTARPAGDSRRRHAARLHQPCAAHAAGDRCARPQASPAGSPTGSIPPCRVSSENLAGPRRHGMEAPLLGVVAHGSSPEDAAHALRLPERTRP
jgi:dethiobiotin synthetase